MIVSASHGQLTFAIDVDELVFSNRLSRSDVTIYRLVFFFLFRLPPGLECV